MSINNFICLNGEKILPFLSLLSFIYQFILNYYYYSEFKLIYNSSALLIIKIIYIFFYFMSLLSFIMAYIAGPGFVTSETNEKFLNIYHKTRKSSLLKAEKYNKKHYLNNNDSNKNNKKGDENYNQKCQECQIIRFLA